jgi:hypothetical protein
MNPGETAEKIGNAADSILFKPIREGFENDNLVYGIGQVWAGTLNDIALGYGAYGTASGLMAETAGARLNGVLIAGNIFAKENPVLFNSVMDGLSSMAYPNLSDTVPYLTKGNYGLPVGEVVQINKAAYYTGLNELAAGNQMRVVGPFKDYLYMSEALKVNPFYIDTPYWNNMTTLQSTTANFKFIERGAVKNDIFILSNPDRYPSKYGSGLKNETYWLENFFDYKKAEDRIKYIK